jgi:hypothetical protein
MLKILHEHFEPILTITSKSSKNSAASSNGKSANSNNKKGNKFSINNPNVKDKQQHQHQQQQQSLKANEKQRKPKMTSIVKSKKINPEYGKGSINPITRLIQIQHGINEQEPVFELLNEQQSNAYSKNKVKLPNQFVIQCTIQRKKPINTTSSTASISTSVTSRNEQNQQVKVSGNEIMKSEGRGATKKLAKANAAQAMLVQLGYSPSNQPVQSVLKSSIKPEKKANESTNQISSQAQETSLNKESNTEASLTCNTTAKIESNEMQSEDKHEVEKMEKKVKFSEEIDKEEYERSQSNKTGN